MRSVSLVLTLALAACGGASASSPHDKPVDVPVEPGWVDVSDDYPAPVTSRLEAAPEPTPPAIAIRDATVLTATGERIEAGTVVVDGGRLSYVGPTAGAKLPEGVTVIDGRGRFVTPGIIDAHSHIGVYAAPNVSAHEDGNEATAPVTAQARAAWAYWPQDPAITRAAAGGVTAMLVLPGSANLVGGSGVTVVTRTGASVDDVLFPAAPPTLKMACGENPKRVYGEKGGPQTRMAVYAAFRAAFQQAAEYRAKQRAYARARELWQTKRQRGEQLASTGVKIKSELAPEPPPHDAKLETLAQVLDGDVLVHVHCYRAVEIREMVRIADEFGFAIRAFHHALGAYKVRDLLVKHDIAIATWADWWGFKMEAFDGIMENAALFAESGGRAVIHSDSDIGIQRLNQEAAKAMYAGRAAGIAIDEDQALRWITANPAWMLGIHDQTGTLEVGKRGDVVVWSASPFSVYALPELVLSGGAPVYDRRVGLRPTDFELGNAAIAAPSAPGHAR